MLYIEDEVRVNGFAKAGVRAYLYYQNDDGSRGSLIASEVTPSPNSKQPQSIHSVGRYFFGNLQSGTYVVYLMGGGLDGNRNPSHRKQFAIVDDNPIPSDTLLLSGGTTLVLYANGGTPSPMPWGQVSKTSSSIGDLVNHSYTGLTEQPTELATINATEGAKLTNIYSGGGGGVVAGDGVTGLTEYSNDTGLYKVVYAYPYRRRPNDATIEYVGICKCTLGGSGNILKAEVLSATGGTEVYASGTTILTAAHLQYYPTTISINLSSSIVVGSLYVIHISIINAVGETMHIRGGYLDFRT